MSQCLACGHCCEHMSPISSPSPCPHIVRHAEEDGLPDIVLCSIYENRPGQCRTHDFPQHRLCPVGTDVLQGSFRCPHDIARRIDRAYFLSRGEE